MLKMTSLFLLIPFLLTGTTANARGLRVQSHQTSQNTTYIGLEDALLNDQPFGDQTPGRIYFYGDYSLVRQPWIDLDDNGDVFQGTLIDKAEVLNLGVGWLANENLQFGVEIPIEILTTENSPAVNAALNGSSTTGLGDSRLFAKWRLYKSESNFAVALRPTLFLPTGFNATNNYYATAVSTEKTGIGASWNSFGAGLSISAEKQFRRFLLSLNAGVEYHPNSLLDGRRSIMATTAEYTKVDVRWVYPVALGAFVRVTERWGINLEALARLTGKHNEYTQPGEFYAGLRYQVSKLISAHIGYGGSLGLKNATGERYVVGIKLPLFDGSSHGESVDNSQAAVQEPTPTPPPPPVVQFTKEKLELSQTVEFETGNASLTEAGRKLLDQVAETLLKHRDQFKRVLIEGHTDHVGSLKNNQSLSERRAASVKEYLISRGLEGEKLSTQGFGETRPLIKGEHLSTEQMLKNRRVEFHLK